MNYQLVSALLKANWAIDPQFAINSLPMVGDLLQGKTVFESNNDILHQAAVIVVGASRPTYHNLNDAPEHSFAVIHLTGALLKDDQACGARGMASIGVAINDADMNPNIDGICLSIDSPGGTVDGTAALADIVKSTQKPIVAFVDGLMASAALWIGSSTDHIVASNDFAQIGSVGVLVSFSDIQPAYEKLGIKFHTITAPQSTEKVKMWEDLRTGNYEQYKNEVLAPLAEEFINVITANRPSVEEKHLKGKVFYAREVMGVFTDEIGDINVALNYLATQVEERKTQPQSIINTPEMKKPLLKLNTTIGAELVVAEDGAHLSAENLEAVETALEQLAVDPNVQLQADLDLANTDLVDANATIATQLETIANQTAEIVTLKGKPAGETTIAITDKDKSDLGNSDSNVVKEGNSFMENLNAVKAEYL